MTESDILLLAIALIGFLAGLAMMFVWAPYH
jgi:hypothetical protein